jgi:maltose/moltooligosaccharide transporter
MWIYSTPAITSHVFGSSDTTSELYNNGADWVGVLFGIYNGAAAILAFLIMWLAKITNRKLTHFISLTIGAISLISIYFIHDKYTLLIPFIGIGMVWASILAMPYAILTGALPSEKMGTYMGIFNFFIVIPQILAASILGFFVKKLFHEQAIYALLLGGFSFLIAAILIIFVDDKTGKKLKTKKL